MALALIGGVWLIQFCRSRAWALPGADGRERDFAKLVTIAALLGYGGGGLAGWAIGLNWLPRHGFYLHPLLMLIIVLPLLSSEGSSRRWQPVIVLLAVVGLNLYSAQNYFFDSRYWRDDYRGTARILMRPENRAIPALLLWGNSNLLAHYDATHVMDGHDIVGRNVGTQILSRSEGSPMVIAVINREFYWNQGVLFSESVEDTYFIDRIVNLNNVNIYYLIRR